MTNFMALVACYIHLFDGKCDKSGTFSTLRVMKQMNTKKGSYWKQRFLEQTIYYDMKDLAMACLHFKQREPVYYKPKQSNISQQCVSINPKYLLDWPRK